MHKILRVLTAICVIAGIGYTVSALRSDTRAMLMGQGTVLDVPGISTPPTTETMRPAAEALQSADAAGTLALGILLILLGLFLHAWIRMHHRDNGERPVKVHAAKNAPTKRVQSWFWLEMKI